jgi:hypothetical protein
VCSCGAGLRACHQAFSASHAVQGTAVTWADCFKCYYSNFDAAGCSKLTVEDRAQFVQCATQRQFGPVHYGLYAAQLSWWLAFFPPQQFFFITSSQLQSKEQRIEVCAKRVDQDCNTIEALDMYCSLP